MGLTPDLTKLTSEQRDKLDAYQAQQSQLQAIQDIADMTQEVVNILDDKKQDKSVDNIGRVLLDIKESLGVIKAKEAPEVPDYAKPVVEAVSRLEKALSASIKQIDVKPQVKVNAPQVNVKPSDVDLKGVEKALGAMPNAFKEAIKLIPEVEIPETDFTPLLSTLENISEQLSSIDTATRMKPQPGRMAVSNLNEINLAPNIFNDYEDIELTDADVNGNYQVISFKTGNLTHYTLNLTYDGNSNVTNISRV